MEPQTAVDLLEHRDFVRAVVRGLLADEHAVDDVVQETCLRAIERPPRALRGWLARVARNLALTARRRERSRDRREYRAARPERQPSAVEAASRLERHRLVVEAVLALEEPFRSAILLRFYDDLPPRAIARELGVPVETVRSRVRRGLERLRAHLRARHGAAWSLAFLPLAGGALMSAKKKLSVVAVLLCIAAVGTVAWQSAPRAASARRAAEVEGVRGQEAEIPTAPEPPQVHAPAGVGAAPEASASVAAEPPKPYRLAEATADGQGALRVITRDDTDHVLAWVNLAISYRGRARRLVTGADGRAELTSAPPGSYGVTAILVHRCRSATVEVERGRFTEVVVVFARGAEVEGEVRHVERGPLADVGVAVEVREGGDGFREWFNTNTDAAGRYRLEGVPAGDHPVLVWGGILGQDQHPRVKLAVPGPGPMRFDLVVGRVSLRGGVRDADTGAPLKGVKLKVLWPPHQPAETTSAPNGLYEILDLPAGNHYLVEADGYAPRVWAVPPIPADGAATFDLPLHRAATLVVETRDPSGRLVPGRHAVVLRDASGREVAAFRIAVNLSGWHTGVVPGTYEMTLSADGYAKHTERVDLRAGENRLTLRLEPEPETSRVSLQGIVLDASTRKPVAGARVRIAPPHGVETATDRDGAYRFRELKRGAVSVLVSMDGYGRRSVEAGIGADATTLDIDLDPAATLRLRVTDRTGAPVAGKLSLVIVSRDKKTDMGADIEADADGNAVYRQILPGSYDLLVSQKGVGEAKVEVEISPGENVVALRLD